MPESVAVSHQVLDRRRDGVVSLAEVLGSGLVSGLDTGLEHGVVDLFDALGRLGRERLMTPDAVLLVPGRFPVTPRAREGCMVVPVGVLLDVEAVHRRVGALVRLLAEPSHVALGGLGATLPALTVLDARLAHALEDEPARVGAPEVGRGDVLVHVEPLRRLLEHVEVGVVGEPRRLREVRPEWRVGVARRRMRLEPLVEVGDSYDQVDDALALFAVDVDGEGVLAIDDVADSERLELAAAEAGLELDHDGGSVAMVACGLDHRLHVLLEEEEIALARRRVVAARGAGRNPVDAVRRRTLASDALREDADGTAVIPIRLLVVVLSVDPADDLLGSVAIVDDVREDAGVLGHPRAVPEQLEVPVVRVLTGEQVQLVAELDQSFGVGVSDVASLAGIVHLAPDATAQCVDFTTRIVIAHTSTIDRGIVKIICKALPWLYQKSEQSHAGSPDVGVQLPVESQSVTPHSAIATAPAAAGMEVSA